MEIYLILKVIWWLLLGVLFMGLGIMVGMDMGVGTILRFVGRTDLERRVVINGIGPHWDGNQVWFILGGGAIFAAFPLIYGTAFSGFYVVMLLLLWSMIVRPLAFEYRSKKESATWRSGWDWMLFLSGFLPMVVFGAAIGNILQGVPFHFSWNLTSYYTGSFLALFNPFAILCGLLSVALACFVGAATVANGADGDIARRARQVSTYSGVAAIVLYVIGGIWLRSIDFYVLDAGPSGNLAQTPLQQTVSVHAGALYHNYAAYPILWVLPALAILALAVGIGAARSGKSHLSWWLGALAWIGVIGSVGASMFPFMMPSSTHPSHSLTLWNSSSSQLTLTWMVGFALVFVPLILWYTSWCYYVMRGKVDPKHVERDEHAY